jgi:hypothetical protein
MTWRHRLIAAWATNARISGGMTKNERHILSPLHLRSMQTQISGFATSIETEREIHLRLSTGTVTAQRAERADFHLRVIVSAAYRAGIQKTTYKFTSPGTVSVPS